jgi:hemoglobin
MVDDRSLYEWAGGGDALRRLIDCFYDRVERDEMLSGSFPGGVSDEHRAHVTAWWSEAFGGPARCTGEFAGDKRVLRHRDLGITAEQQQRLASTMSLAADDADLPADPEFRAALVYLEWSTRLAMESPRP